jgi:hypothetical protein
MEGIPSVIGAMLGGGYLSVGSKAGTTGGFSPIHDALMEDGNLYESIGKAVVGASGAYVSNIWGTLHPYFQVFADPQNFKPTMDDLFATARAFSSGLDQVSKNLIAYNTGQVMTRSGTVLESNVPKMQSLLTLLTGIQSQQSQNTFLMRGMEGTQANLWKNAKNSFLTEWGRGMRNSAAGNNPEADINFRNAYSYLRVAGFPTERYSEVFKEASLANKSLIDKLDYSYWIKNVPPREAASRLDTWRRIQEVKGSR